MANILKIKNKQGEWKDIPAIKGDTGEQGPIGPQGPKGDTGEVTTQQMTDYVAQELVSKQDKLYSYSDSASVANDKLTINYKVKQEDGTYSNVPVEFSGGSKYTFTNGLTETNGTVKLGGKLSTDDGAILKSNSYYGNFITFDNNQSGSSHHYISINNVSTLGFSLSIDGESEGLKIYANSPRKIYSTLPIIPSGFNNQDINIDLGNDAHKWRTLYCDNLSDGTTTKTMTEVLNKQDKLTAGNNITISEDNVISATIPTKTSQLTNDSGYLVNNDLPLVTYSDSKLSDGTDLKSIQVGDDKWNIPTYVKSVTPSKETWTFTLSDGSTVTKTIVTGITVA